MNVIFCSSEVVPFAKTGGLADVCGALPLALEKIGVNVSIFLPHYPCVEKVGYTVKAIDKNVLMTTIGTNVKVYFVENKHFFDRDEIYGGADGDYKDNLERFQFFCMQILVLLKEWNEPIDILHCHDWQTALIPVYLKEKYDDDSFYADTKSILTIHNLAYQGVFPAKIYDKLGLDPKLFNHKVFEFFDKVNLLKAGIVYSDEVTTVSPQYSKEIQTKEFGCGLEGVLHAREETVAGILNGLDYDVWNPQTDEFIIKNYNGNNFCEGKEINKKAVQEELGLPIQKNVPLFGFIARLTHQKGIDLVLESIDVLAQLDVQIIIQGIGDEKYYSLVSELALRYPKKVAVCLEFNDHIAHQVYAGCDLFLMPSLFEPCGLSQMISLQYGTVPIVFKTGGLADTIQPFDSITGEGNGFVFEEYTQKSFIQVIKGAMDVFGEKEVFTQIIHNAFASNFCWEKAAEEYKKNYQCMLSASQGV
ncbi:Glycogen synthase, ADP-glucose transglucosylase [hydrothermal vent metagenome]|uniref:starch synthase n=1 Tax=hydrothermal vent metagenome TaxID=652676 RepID=A0A3B1DK07_9ZZZZ